MAILSKRNIADGSEPLYRSKATKGIGYALWSLNEPHSRKRYLVLARLLSRRQPIKLTAEIMKTAFPRCQGQPDYLVLAIGHGHNCMSDNDTAVA